MPANVKPATRPLLATRLQRLRLQAMATEISLLVGQNIRTARREQDRYNQRELAAEIQERDPRYAPSNQRVSDWERGIQKPTDRNMRLIAEILEKPVSWFYEDHTSDKTPELEDVLPQPIEELTEVRERLANVEDQLERIIRLLGPGGGQQERRTA